MSHWGSCIQDFGLTIVYSGVLHFFSEIHVTWCDVKRKVIIEVSKEY